MVYQQNDNEHDSVLRAFEPNIFSIFQWSLIYRLVLGKTKPGYIARRLRVLLPATITWTQDRDEGNLVTNYSEQRYIYHIQFQAGKSKNGRDPGRLKGLIEFFFEEDNKSHYNLEDVLHIELLQVARCPERIVCC
mmetsp:Transcript_35097/g.65018  ORF Transcript_35097/g.65018 Transcript_35097/m.65018 type:complete len:135 (-) Transcript_35097:133-537(-)